MELLSFIYSKSIYLKVKFMGLWLKERFQHPLWHHRHAKGLIRHLDKLSALQKGKMLVILSFQQTRNPLGNVPLVKTGRGKKWGLMRFIMSIVVANLSAVHVTPRPFIQASYIQLFAGRGIHILQYKDWTSNCNTEVVLDNKLSRNFRWHFLQFVAIWYSWL